MKDEAEYCYEAPGYTNPSTQVGLERRLLDIVRGFHGVERICDLGSGNGRFALELANHVNSVVGIDRSATGVDIARKAAHGRSGIAFHCAGLSGELADSLPELGGPFDVVLSVDVIEHLFAPHVLIDLAWRMLRPQGHLVICTPYHGYLKNLAISIVDGWDAHHGVQIVGGHIKFFSVRTLGHLIGQRGFRALRYQYFGRAPFLWKNMICIAERPA